MMEGIQERGRGRFDGVLSETIKTENVARERRDLEQRYRRQLARTDRLLGILEARNMDDQVELDTGLRREIAETLLDVSPRARARFPAATTVQEALDGIFEVQEEIMLPLQRLVHWDELLSAPWAADLGQVSPGGLTPAEPVRGRRRTARPASRVS